MRKRTKKFLNELQGVMQKYGMHRMYVSGDEDCIRFTLDKDGYKQVIVTEWRNGKYYCVDEYDNNYSPSK